MPATGHPTPLGGHPRALRRYGLSRLISKIAQYLRSDGGVGIEHPVQQCRVGLSVASLLRAPPSPRQAQELCSLDDLSLTVMPLIDKREITAGWTLVALLYVLADSPLRGWD
jgi:hypothetical protein